MCTLCLQFHVCLLHDPQFCIGREHLGPLLHAFEDLGLDLLMSILHDVSVSNLSTPPVHDPYPVVRQPQERIGETPRSQFAVHSDTAVLGQSVAKLQGIKLYIRISMGESLDHGGDDIFAARVAGTDFITDVKDELPILGGEVFVGRFGYEDS